MATNTLQIPAISPVPPTANRSDAKSRASVSSFHSSISDTAHHIVEIFSSRSTVKELAKLAQVTCIPMLVVIALCVQSLIRVRRDIDISKKINASVDDSLVLAGLGSILIRERGFRCQLATLVDEDTSDIATYVRNTLVEAENDTDRLVTEASNRLPTVFEKFKSELAIMRRVTRLDEKTRTCSNILDWYTRYSLGLIERATDPFKASDSDGGFWSAVFAYESLLTAKDMLGWERVIASYYFAEGGFPSNEYYINLSQRNGTGDALFQRVTFVLYPPAKEGFEKGMAEIPREASAVYDGLRTVFEYDQTGLRANADAADAFFDDFGVYVDVINRIEDAMPDYMRTLIAAKSKQNQFDYSLTVGLVVVAMIASPIAAVWYAWQTRRMMSRIAAFAEKLREQHVQLELERRRADLLLHQIIPKEIAARIRQNQMAAPESFQDATVYFSDIFGFADIVASSEPFQIVGLLNSLYSKMDRILDQYDAYKVETIADSYMVVSGVPVRNGRQHSQVICKMALNILMEMETIHDPNDYTKSIRLRIGINTGCLVAGIVGLRNQRYCLFGDTINTASRMMSHGMANRIQISIRTKIHLDRHFPDEFETHERGEMNVKGKGNMVTFWLLKKRDFPYRIEICHA